MRDDPPTAPDDAAAARDGPRPRLGSALAAVAGCLWGPFGWLLIPAAVDSPWSHTHLRWIAMWPVLPGWLPGYACRGDGGWWSFAVMGGVTGLLFVGLVSLARLSRPLLAAAASIALLVSVPTSGIAYVAFRW